VWANSEKALPAQPAQIRKTNDAFPEKAKEDKDT
jgi:hypothetical protein